ncbi:MAG TPA: family 78 glycoside hydrolase catalytic domain [Candidatus Hydrogenedentes bacterium]|nr:family 78 glycoside hydrolase catalytic domain [Candidatus Hydrogenedentota bacterium]
MRRIAIGLLLALIVVAAGCQHLPSGVKAGTLQPTGLRCEYLENPLGIDKAAPRLSWINESVDPEARGKTQTAYRILAASSAERLEGDTGDLWDSGRVCCADSIQAPYGGQALGARRRVYWKVRVWDEAGMVSAWSEPAWFETGLLADDDWSALWITRNEALPENEEALFDDRPAPLFRKEFRIEKPVRKARAYVTGLGYYELRLNGAKVGDHWLDPGWTSVSQRVLYAVYDVKDVLRQGTNAVGIMLGNGWYNPLPLLMWGHVNIRENLTIGLPRAILQLEVEYADGTRDRIVTDASWKAGAGPVVRNSVYLGEVYDARLEQPGWDAPGFDDSRWEGVMEAPSEVGPLVAQMAPPIKVGRSIRPASVHEPAPGTFIFDMGENFAGLARLRVEGPAGTRVALRYGELLQDDGTLNPMTAVCGQIKNRERPPDSKRPATAWQEDVYILKGDGVETYVPRFTFRGFRYVEVTGFPGTPSLENLEGLVMYSAIEPAGTFRCGNDLYNQIQDVTRRTFLSNLFSVQSDCPHREKFGYGGDIVASSEALIFNFNMAGFYTKAVEDLADAARPNGGFTETSPFVGIADAGLGGGSGPIGWGTAHPLLLRQLHQYYGDRRLIEAQYERVKAWLELIEANAPEHIYVGGISDHESLVEKPELTGTAFYAYNVALAREFAALLGRKDDAARYDALGAKIAAAFNSRYLEPETGRYGAGTQASQAFPLYMNLVPDSARARALDVLINDIAARDGHLSTGIFGTKYVLDVLSAMGRHDAACAMAGKRAFPGWGYMIEKGATTLWEHWEGSDNTFSNNHPMFGSVSEWFFKHVAGIRPAPDAVGCNRVIIAPGPPQPGLEWAEASYSSVRGLIRAAWRVEGENLHLDVTVPVGVTARVVLPVDAGTELLESGVPAATAAGVAPATGDGSAPSFDVGSGTYHFKARL